MLNGLLWSYLALVPLVLIGALLTSAALPAVRALGAVALVPFVAVPFLLLGVFVSVVQAVVFTLMSSVYIGMAVAHEEH